MWKKKRAPPVPESILLLVNRCPFTLRFFDADARFSLRPDCFTPGKHEGYCLPKDEGPGHLSTTRDNSITYLYGIFAKKSFRDYDLCVHYPRRTMTERTIFEQPHLDWKVPTDGFRAHRRRR